jgi:hypothetical protein
MAKKQKTIWIQCYSCGNKEREHRILYEKRIGCLADEEGPVVGEDLYRLVECMGCRNIKYVTSTIDYYDENPKEQNFKIYPDSIMDNSSLRKPRIGDEDSIHFNWQSFIPEIVAKMYIETIASFNAGSLTLAGGGLRAVVEAICLDKQIQAKNLMLKIDGLVTQGFLAKKQADHLHEERYLGNAALHELTTPSKEDIEDGLEIVEGLINTIYILPAKAERLKKKREAKNPIPPTK